jgi:sigma54-dependent transcription regulator
VPKWWIGSASGRSPARARIRLALAQAERVAATTSTVLLVGETGTGKERFATVIHGLSTRRNRPMVTVNCAAIPSTLMESELFGREKGAYTGALSRQAGRFEVADGSTLFLDEISDLPTEVQVGAGAAGEAGRAAGSRSPFWSMCGSSRRRTRISKRQSAAGNSAKTCTTA